MKESLITCPLRSAARDVPDQPAISSAEHSLTFGEWDALAAGVAARLRSGGARPGDRAALLMDRSWRTLAVFFGCWRAGLVVAPLSTHLPKDVIWDYLRRGGADELITDRSTKRVNGDWQIRTTRSLFSGINEAANLVKVSTWEMDAPSSIVFTTGSTGIPKAALHTFGNHVHSAEGANATLPLAAGDRWLLALPLYHVGGLGVVMRCLLARATIVIPETKRSLLNEIVNCHITHVSLVPTQLRRMLEEGQDRSPSSLKAILIGGAPVPPSILEAAHDRGWPLYTTYGLTEMTSQVTTTSPGASLEQLQSSGRLLPHRELKIGEGGEILVRGATLFRGYVNGDQVDRAVDESGWFHTRDVGYQDAHGNLHVTGRLDNQFISGGENIQPESIERALSQCPGVIQAVVVPIPDEEYGQRPVAFVEAQDDVMTPRMWRKALEKQLPRFMVPERFYSWPGHMQGLKVPRAALQEEARRCTSPGR